MNRPKMSCSKVVLMATSACFSFFSTHALGFGDAGHLTVCQIAWEATSSHTQSSIEDLLPKNPDGTRRRVSDQFARQCIWPDQVKRTPQWRSTANFHFINVETFMGENPPDQAVTWDDPSAFALGGDMLQAIVAAKRALTPGNGVSPAAKLCHLRFLGHLAGDSHQPMHYGKKSDFGGNSILIPWKNIEKFPLHVIKLDEKRPVCIDLGDEDPSTGQKCVFIEKLGQIKTNLHLLWDDAFIDASLQARGLMPAGGQTPNPFAYFPAYTRQLLSGTTADVSDYKKQSILQWAAGTIDYRAPLAYTGIRFDRKVKVIGSDGLPAKNSAGQELEDNIYAITPLGSDESYYQNRIGVIESQLIKGGYHLAGLLDRIFSSQEIEPGLKAYHDAADTELEQRIITARQTKMIAENQAAKASGKPERHSQAAIEQATLQSPCDAL